MGWFGQGPAGGLLALHQADLLGWLDHGGEPVYQHALVGMGGVGTLLVVGGLAWDMFVDHLPAGCPFGLVPHQEYIITRVFQAVFKMADNTSAGAHAAAGDDDDRAIRQDRVSIWRVEEEKYNWDTIAKQ